ncbi:Eco57I restriction-modification methylase domain-containing protein [Kordia jejudonensis]|uniref:Eco57I restriction-modification methylase domain-containing protein n=1 Tax=Kordia jejudonensis TaxID=1348245 RepID=UPI000629400B|nr:Eco57I restriction-modification methylase domain-containing protein [Kordia jejudonensis]
MQDFKKRTGSYYTPHYLANFISKRVLSHFENRVRMSILEPSVGDGAFISELGKEENINIKLTALDINEGELNIASEKWNKKTASFIRTDFLEYSTTKKYSAVIGNPPYIKKNILTSNQIELSKKIHSNENLTEASVKNIWITFLVKANTLLSKNGVLAFVLPSELLQVKYAEEVREYLKKEFARIEIFTFNNLMFECKGQDTIVLFAYKKSKQKGEFFTNISSKESLEQNDFVLNNNNLLIESKVKWTHHFLTSDELTFIDNLKKGLKTVNDYSDSKPGIVTAANKFFIINKEIEKQYNLSRFTKPIIQKGLFVNGSVVFNDEDILRLEEKNHPTRLLQLNDSDTISKKLREYLTIGETEKIPNRYKCKIRNNWYVIPNISEKPDALFFKRSHLYPKLLKNNSDAFVTDSAYKVEMKGSYDLNSFIYSFYNTLTLLLSELDGRYYGGGVLELIPSEFKKLPIPYTKISDKEFDTFTTNFENKLNIEEILNQNDFNILNSILGVNYKDLEKIRAIKSKLTNKRMRV